MKKTAKNTQSEVEILRAELAKQARLIEKKEREIEKLKKEKFAMFEELRLGRVRRYGASSEKGDNPQLPLFNEAEDAVDQLEQELDVEEADATQETTTVVKKAAKPKVRRPLPENLPREEVIIDLTDEEKQCDTCGNPLHKMGEYRVKKLEFVPAKVVVKVYVYPKYSCRECDKNGTEVKVKRAPLKPSPIPKSFVTPSLLSEIIVNKYQFALPLYRQEAVLKQHGIDIPRATTSSWMIKASHLFKPLYERLHEILLTQPVIHADETKLKVNKDKERKSSYMWVYATGSDSLVKNEDIRHIVLFDYHHGARSAACPIKFLDGYNQYLQVDGYAAYEKTKATLAGCWAHARRKFVEADKAAPAPKKGKPTRATKAKVAIAKIAKLYAIEQRCKDKTADERYQARQEQAKPILDDLKGWLDKNIEKAVPSTLLYKALSYTLGQWDKLTTYVEDGNIKIDNNRAERAVKPFVIGRKNWLFSETHSGATSSTRLYSIIETAKSNGLDPTRYITLCLEELCKPEPNIDMLLPWNVEC